MVNRISRTVARRRWARPRGIDLRVRAGIIRGMISQSNSTRPRTGGTSWPGPTLPAPKALALDVVTMVRVVEAGEAPGVRVAGEKVAAHPRGSPEQLNE